MPTDHAALALLMMCDLVFLRQFNKKRMNDLLQAPRQSEARQSVGLAPKGNPDDNRCPLPDRSRNS
jgi:hypothetical protein